jgi:hypothetical protein
MASFNLSNKLMEKRQSTRNNSLIENLMMEDATTTDLTDGSVHVLEENLLKYTCKECNLITTSREQIDDHVRSKHLPDSDEEVRFVCIVCQHEFIEVRTTKNMSNNMS